MVAGSIRDINGISDHIDAMDALTVPGKKTSSDLTEGGLSLFILNIFRFMLFPKLVPLEFCSVLPCGFFLTIF